MDFPTLTAAPGHRPDMLIYVGETTLLEMVLEVLRSRVVSVRALSLETIPVPFVPAIGRITWIDVLPPDYGRARDVADVLEARGHWILVPDGTRSKGRCSARKALEGESAGPRCDGIGLRRVKAS